MLVGLEPIGFDMPAHPMVRRCVSWLEKVQQPCGGWGESCASYDDPTLAGQGPVTASQTAWKPLLGLLMASRRGVESDAVQGGIDYLLATQQPDGNWHEEQFDGGDRLPEGLLP